MNESRERRALLATRPNQSPSLEYVVSLEFALPLAEGDARLFVRYVPDRVLLDTQGLAPYLELFGTAQGERIEQAAVTVLGDLNSELVPRWVQVLVRAGGSGPGVGEILVEDRQPNWDNASLLAGLRPL